MRDREGVMKRVWAMSGLLLATAAAQGRECRGVSFPEHVQVGGAALTLNGLGMHQATFLKLDVYVGALYVSAVSRDPDALIASDGPQELILHFVRGLGVQDLRRAWTE